MYSMMELLLAAGCWLLAVATGLMAIRAFVACRLQHSPQPCHTTQGANSGISAAATAMLRGGDGTANGAGAVMPAAPHALWHFAPHTQRSCGRRSGGGTAAVGGAGAGAGLLPTLRRAR